MLPNEDFRRPNNFGINPSEKVKGWSGLPKSSFGGIKSSNVLIRLKWGEYDSRAIHSRLPARSIACKRVCRRWLIRRVFSGDATNGGGCCACLTAPTHRPMEVSAV